MTNNMAQQPQDFESAKTRLEEIVDAVSDDSLPLDDALDLFEEAVTLGLKVSDFIESGIVVDEDESEREGARGLENEREGARGLESEREDARGGKAAAESGEDQASDQKSAAMSAAGQAAIADSAPDAPSQESSESAGFPAAAGISKAVRATAAE